MPKHVLPLAAIALAFGALHACSNGGDGGAGGAPPAPTGDSGVAVDVAPEVDDAGGSRDANVGVVPACETSKTPAPFPSGDCNAPRPTKPDSFDEALGLAGIDRCKLELDPKQVPASGWDLNDPRRLPDYQALVLHPLRLPAYGAEMAAWLDAAIASEHPLSGAIVAASQRRGAALTTCADPSWYVIDGGDAAPLASALIELGDAYGQPVDQGATIASVASLPIDLQRALVPVVRAIGYGAQSVVAARKTTDGKLLNLLAAVPSWVIGSRNLPLSPAFLAALDGFDVASITQSAAYVATAIEAGKLDRFAGLTIPAFEVPTPFGAIVIHGGGVDTYEQGSLADGAALLIDLGGNDVYRVPAGSATLKLPVSIAIDLGGDDRYGYVEHPIAADAIGSRLPSDNAGRSPTTNSRVGRQGSGVMGIGMLVDLGKGTDRYQSLAISQGAGILGVGVLYDEGGDDSYGSEVLSQGAAGWGVGLLLDRAGNDKHLAYNEAQGFGATQGFGALVDEAGDDTYFTDPGDPALKGDALYPSAQLPDKGNTSMSQGCGQGRRFDTVPEGIGFIGGMGVLRDAAGKDSYVTSVFGQGCGFQGAGFLLEGGGDDTYEGLWYVQGADAHLGVAYFDDHAGNDKYDPTFPIAATSIGVGHDFSVAVHYDEGGDDTYAAPGLSLGSGYDNGIGILVNVGGTDRFSAGGNPTMGGAALDGDLAKTTRKRMPTYGAFTKAGGSASYFIAGVDAARSGGSWSFAPENTPDGGVDGGPTLSFEKSTGVDRPTGTASLP